MDTIFNCFGNRVQSQSYVDYSARVMQKKIIYSHEQEDPDDEDSPCIEDNYFSKGLDGFSMNNKYVFFWNESDIWYFDKESLRTNNYYS